MVAFPIWPEILTAPGYDAMTDMDCVAPVT
jgi:hypothetical protein